MTSLASSVGSALLRKFSPRGGSSGNRALDVPRVARLMQESTPDELYEFLLTVAREARLDAEMDQRANQRELAYALEKINADLDSHRLHLFIERYKERPGEVAQDEEATRA